MQTLDKVGEGPKVRSIALKINHSLRVVYYFLNGRLTRKDKQTLSFREQRSFSVALHPLK